MKHKQHPCTRHAHHPNDGPCIQAGQIPTPPLPIGIRAQLEAMSRAILERRDYKDLEKPQRDHPDSDELTVFICQQLEAAGAKYRIRVVGSSPEKGPDAQFHHCFAEVWHEPSKTWISLDPFQATKSWAADEIWEVQHPVVVCEPIPVPASGGMTCRRGRGQRTFQGQKPPTCDGFLQRQPSLPSLYSCVKCELVHATTTKDGILVYGAVL